MAKQEEPKQRYVYAKWTGTVYDKDQIGYRHFAGQPILPTDPLVKLRPELFADEPPAEALLRSVPFEPPRVEHATRAPGEVRA